MKAKISQIIEKSQSVSMPSVSLLLELIPRQKVLDIIAETQLNEKRRRKLRSEWVMWI
jgi:hypothetical protein